MFSPSVGILENPVTCLVSVLAPGDNVQKHCIPQPGACHLSVIHTPACATGRYMFIINSQFINKRL